MTEREHCRLCGERLVKGVCPSCSNQEAHRVLHRDVLLLLLLSLLAVGLFLATKALARTERSLERREARTWYDKGRAQSNAGNIEGAINSYRQALAGDRDNRAFALSLANALAAGKHPDEARETLLRLRDLDPEDAEINLALARLEASLGRIPDAIHFYQNALYGRWTGTQVDERRRQVRLELVQFLLYHREQGRALSELLILGSDTPETASAKWKLARLYLAAGDKQSALQYYDEGLRLEPGNARVRGEAGETAFQVGDYSRAQDYLKSSIDQGNTADSTRKLFSLTHDILILDPLQPRLTMEDRRVRLLQDLEHALTRAAGCIDDEPNDEKSQLQSLKSNGSSLQHVLQLHRDLHDIDDVRSGFELVYRIEDAANAACGQASGPDLALALIWRSHGSAQ